MKKHYTYTLSDSLGNVFYVGKGTKKEGYNRLDFHSKYNYHNHNKHLVNTINKLNGQFVVTLLLESNSEKDCLELEKAKIKEFRDSGHKLCNLTDGGEGICGYKHTRITKELMSKTKGSKESVLKSIQNIKKAQASNVGRRKVSDEQILKLYDYMTIREITQTIGIAFSTIKRRLVEIDAYVPNKNRKPTTREAKENQSKGQQLRVDRRCVIQLDFNGQIIKEWDNAQQASKYYGNCVRDCLRGRQKTAYGFLWKYQIKAV
jgi:hypothetical protein